ncbi:tRNA lysidine(34) synthetase TilS [Cellulomonas denverensis]|uniref:tRNA(Ile)-lysidine synthase n=1 Tax=Cellulomonas denverensis TaxID=264297 RepID=A0A7X6KSP5_9CELL|nr:tRNA lysidine(34) synthetase TilS [Cellulomonas denverensis]NKY21557.1 tRNA lysidine(34) synthetase TilS [Cellulomonas denverensis]GIG25448.1 tRNA(Ile)-lysidine synthase [Cellulomonas denverensis]
MPGPAPAVARTRSAVTTACADLPPGALVLVACSGGADSLALAAATAFAVRDHGPLALRAGAVVVDHGLQPGSAGVAQAAADRCRALGLDPVQVRTVQVDGGGGPEAAAREARYAALTAAATELGAAAVLLGHTRDDQAEGVLLGLARGSGARSLAGMAPVRGLWRRPLLGLPRADTEAACAALGLDPWQDPTNTPAPDDPAAPLRSRLRIRVLPVLESELGPGVAAALARTATGLREDADALDAWAEELAGRAITPDASGAAVLVDPDLLATAPAALRRRVLRLAALRAGVPAAALTRAHLLAVDGLLTDWHGQGPVHLPGRVEALRACGRLALRGGAPSPAATDQP